MQRMTVDQWQQELLQSATLSAKNALIPLLPLLVTPFSETDKRTLLALMEHEKTSIDCANTRTALAQHEIVCPQVDIARFKTYLSYWIDSGFLAASQAGKKEL